MFRPWRVELVHGNPVYGYYVSSLQVCFKSSGRITWLAWAQDGKIIVPSSWKMKRLWSFKRHSISCLLLQVKYIAYTIQLPKDKLYLQNHITGHAMVYEFNVAHCFSGTTSTFYMLLDLNELQWCDTPMLRHCAENCCCFLSDCSKTRLSCIVIQIRILVSIKLLSVMDIKWGYVVKLPILSISLV